MNKLTIDDLHPLETYARLRPEFRARVIEHKAHRRLALGEHLSLAFEDRLTMHYQVQEMLRAERIFEPADIEAELAAYNPLIPDGSNWKATLSIEYPDPEERRVALERLLGIEDRIWVQVADGPVIFGIADEDLERAGAPLAVGVDHPQLRLRVDDVPQAMHESLLADLH
jgi:hypothetical protein